MRILPISILSALIISTMSAFGQSDNASLILQSPHGHSVKMLWFFKSWEHDFHGFDIKRREGIQQDWVRLNSKVIYPSFTLKKDIRNVESDKAESDRLRTVATHYLASHKLPELDSFAFAQKMNDDEHFLPELSRMISEDYDLALISGFGYIDRTPSRKIDYEFGLFDHQTGILLARAVWNYGESPDLNLITEITSRSNIRKRGILILWNADQNKVKSGYVHGFNIYRDGIRLNQDPIMINNNSEEGYEWYDSTANSSIANQYAIASESMLDIEGNIRPYTYNPADHPGSYQKATIDEIGSIGYYFKEGIGVTWDFPSGSERFISGFIVEKDNIPSGYREVSPLLDPTIRRFTDKTASSVHNYIRFRIVVIYKDRTFVNSKDKVYSYFPLREPPAPLGLASTGIIKDKSYTISFSWDTPMVGDTVTDYYRLFTIAAATTKLVPVEGAGLIRGNSYNYQMANLNTGINKFCLQAVGKNKSESKLGDTLLVVVPTVDPPRPSALEVTPFENSLKLKWQFNEIFDLKGFRLFINNKLVEGEDSLKKNARELELSLPGGKNYEFKIQAVTTSNITSELSDPAGINLPDQQRKKR